MNNSETSQPLVSVVMNCYNSDRFLKEAIDSVYAQTYPNWEIIFWDNASTDTSSVIAKSYDDRVKYFLSPETTPLGEARSMALKKASGKYIAFLDCDDLYLSEKLETQIKLMEKNSDVGLVYSNTVYFAEGCDDREAYKKNMPSGYIFKDLLEGYFMSFETVMIRKSVIDERGILFNPEYRVSTDAEIFIRIAYYTKCLYIDKVLAKWRYGHGSESDKSLCLFPEEYEMLLEHLTEEINGFENAYGSSIKILRSKIANMYGVCCWSQNNIHQAREYFRSAVGYNLKYLVPLLLSFLMSYDAYRKLKRKFGKI